MHYMYRITALPLHCMLLIEALLRIIEALHS